MSKETPPDVFEIFKNSIKSMGFAIPGFVTPTLDTNELDKKINDLKAVETWLQMNLNLLKMNIQGLEVQKGTLNAIQAISRQAAENTTPDKTGSAANAAPTVADMMGTMQTMWPSWLNPVADSNVPTASKPQTAAPRKREPTSSKSPKRSNNT